MTTPLPTTPQYTCPICEKKLQKSKRSYLCENNHCFDISREGYVNLLPVQKKKSINPGDNRVMIQSRRDFLNRHFYDLLIEPSARIIDEFIVERFTKQCRLLDIGCGDGYFTSSIYKQLTQTAFCYGMDISKEAVKFSARHNRTISWFVASHNDIPLHDKSIDIILKINAPFDYQKNRIKLADNGIIVSITPGKLHLNGLKSIIYENVNLHQEEACPSKHTCLFSTNLVGKIHLKNVTDINNLFVMTPFFWNASQNSINKVNNLSFLKSDIAFDINVWGKQ